jgi:hypothetical protein
MELTRHQIKILRKRNENLNADKIGDNDTSAVADNIENGNGISERDLNAMIMEFVESSVEESVSCCLFISVQVMMSINSWITILSLLFRQV